MFFTSLCAIAIVGMLIAGLNASKSESNNTFLDLSLILLPRTTAKAFPALAKPTFAHNNSTNPPLVNIFLTTPSSSSSSSFEGHPLQVRHKQYWGRGFILLLPRLLYCLDQMLAVVLLSQHRVSSSKTVRPRTPCGARCIGHAVSTWSAVCSEAPHLQFGEGARPHLCMDEWNRPTPVRRRLSLTQATRGKPIPTGLAPVTGTKVRSLEAFSQYSVFHL